MNIDELYESTVLKLKQNERPLVRLGPELVAAIIEKWQRALERPLDEKSLIKIFCILDNTQNTSALFNELFKQTFIKLTNDHLIICALGASQKHIAYHCQITGEKIPDFYFEEMKKLLHNKNAEVFEWTLRTIDSMGPQSRPLQEAVLKNRPGPLKIFSPHLRNAAEIIELLKKQWEKR